MNTRHLRVTCWLVTIRKCERNGAPNCSEDNSSLSISHSRRKLKAQVNWTTNVWYFFWITESVIIQACFNDKLLSSPKHSPLLEFPACECRAKPLMRDLLFRIRSRQLFVDETFSHYRYIRIQIAHYRWFNFSVLLLKCRLVPVHNMASTYSPNMNHAYVAYSARVMRVGSSE